MKVVVNGKEYDLNGVLPLTLRDLRELKKVGIPFGSAGLDMADPDLLSKLLLYLFRKADPEVTEAAVDALTVLQLVTIADYVRDRMAAADRPT